MQNLYEFSKKTLYVVLPPFVIILILVQVQPPLDELLKQVGLIKVQPPLDEYLKQIGLIKVQPPLDELLKQVDIVVGYTFPSLLVGFNIPSLLVTPSSISIPIILTQLPNILVGIAAPPIFYLILTRITLWKDYYLFATAWMQIMYEENDPIQKTKYFEMGLDYYNAYLEGKLRLKINEVQLYSQLLSKSTEDRNRSLKRISRAFLENDTLKPIKESSLFLNSPILGREELQSKIKEVVLILAAVIPIVIAVVQLFLPR